MRILCWISFAQLLFLPLQAHDFGCKGTVFAIQEENLISYWQKEFGNLEKKSQLLSNVKQQMVESALHPHPVTFLKEAETKRSFYVDPSYTVKTEIRDAQGNVVVRKGEKVNPLEELTLSSGLLFFDGDNEEHVAWAKQQQGRWKWILAKGSPLSLEEKESRPVYFDQGGKYSAFFQLEQIPAQVLQEGKLLLVEELPLQDHASGSARFSSASPSSENPPPVPEPAKCRSSWEGVSFEKPELFLFISFSVPLESWKWFSQELEESGGVFVLNGIPKGSFQEFAAQIELLRKEGVGAPIHIDPEAYELYDIQHVPAIVSIRGGKVDQVTGNIPVKRALELFSEGRP